MTDTSVREMRSPIETPDRQPEPAAPRPVPVTRTALLAPVIPGVATGLPIIDVPMLVEPVGFDEPPAEIRPPSADRRPVRRRFLPPVAKPAGDANERALPMLEARPGTSRRPPPEPALAEAVERPGRPVALPGGTAAPRPASAAGPAWRRPVLVGGGVAAALCVATVLEVRASRDWLARLPGVVLQSVAGAPSSPAAGNPPADAAGRLAYYADKAKAGDAQAQIALAVIYAKGDGVAQDYAAAAEWFRRAAQKGVSRAQYDLGVLYERGRGVPQDAAQAAAWYRKAAEQNHPLAQYNLAVAFTKGEGVTRDPFEAAVWYHRAAAQGVVAAMVNLAILYERGEGVDASSADAYAWYRAAARRGSAPAGRRGDELLAAFSPWDQTRAEAKTADIAASIRDSLGERARLVARAATPASASAEPGPKLKSGFVAEGRRNSPQAPAGDNP